LDFGLVIAASRWGRAIWIQLETPKSRIFKLITPDLQNVNPKSKIQDLKSFGGEFYAMAELDIKERQAGDVTVLDMDGKITIGEGSVALRSAVRRLLEEGKKKILLNLAGVGYIDSSGIGELVSSYTAINKEQGQLKLLNLTQKLQDLLAITKLLTVFDVYENETEALNSYK
jgi:anti-sigma B factor antagonist